MQGLRPLIAATLLLVACGQDERARMVDELFSRWDTAETPGAVLAVIRDGKPIYQKAYGIADLERDAPLSLQSVFDIASTSKQFVAMSILLLQEQDKVSLDDDIRIYLPEIPDYGQTITIRHLIHHTSGIRDYMDLMYLAGMKYENSYHRSEIIDLVARQQALDFMSGDEFLYSNSGYLLLAEIIERVSRLPLGEFTARHIFKPLNMNTSQFYEDFMQIVKNRALSYSQNEAGGYSSVQYIFDVVGDTGLLTSVEDLFHWDQNFYRNRIGKGGSKLIEQMLTPGELNSGEKLQYAFGLEIETYRGLSVVRHSGSAAGYRSEMLRFPDLNFTVIILSNLADFSPTKLAEHVADLYLGDEYTAGPRPARAESYEARTARPRGKRPMSSAVPDANTGHYYSAELDVTYVVHLVDGELRYRLGYSPVDIRLTSTGRDEWDSGDATFRFLRDSSAMITGFNLSSGRISDIYFEKIR